MKKIFLLYLWLSCFGSLFAQQKSFTILSYTTKNPIEKVDIYKENQLVTTSDANGIFTINDENIFGTFEFVASGFQKVTFELSLEKLDVIIYLYPSFETLSEVVVRSSSIPKSIIKIPSSVNLITCTDFNRTDATNILESFVNVPGVYVNQGALNTNKINIRGIGARSQYSTNRIQAYFDGIPLTTGEGELTLDDFDQETLDRIEIIKGPTSSIYGAGLGGSVNLFSKGDRSKDTDVSLKSQYGTFNTQKQVVQASINAKNAGIAATFSNLTSDGYRQNGKYNRQSALITSNVALSTKGKLSFLANLTRLKAYIPSSINKDDYLNNPEKADGNWAASQGFESYDRGILGTSYVYSFTENFKSTTSAFMSFKNGFEPRPFDILEDKRTSVGIRTQFNWKTIFISLPTEISFGAAYYDEWYETGTLENLYKDFPNQGSVIGLRLSKNEQKRNFANYFTQLNLNLTEKWSLEAGINVNKTNYRLTDVFNTENINQNEAHDFKTIFSPRIGTSFEVSQGKNIYASVSQGFSVPSVAEALQPDGQINTNLKPEVGINYEIGFKANWLKNKLYTEITAYSIRVSNLLVANRVAEDQYIGSNAGKTNHNGIEFLTQYRFEILDEITVTPFVNSSINFFKFDEYTNNDIDLSGKLIPGVPKFTNTIGLDLVSKKGFNLALNVRSVGKVALDDANTGFADAYNLVNAKTGYTFRFIKKINLNFYAGVNNIFDKHYASSILTNAVGFGQNAPRYYYPGNPINYYCGIQMSYQF